MNILTLLTKLISLQTVTGQLSANNEALDFIEAYLRERSMHIYRTEFNGGYGALVATTRETKTPRIMLAGHIDVVAASPELFTLREQDGKLFGRGVWDMQSAVAGYLLVVDQLKENLADYDFGIMLSTDEETRDLGIKNLITEGWRPTEAAVLLDGGYDWQLQKAAKGSFYGSVTITGQTGHGSRPWLVNSAGMQLVQLLGDIQKLFPDAGPLTNTLNISALQSGMLGHILNQIPAQASAGLDIRALNEAEVSRLKATINSLCEKYGASFEVQVDFKAIDHDMNSPHMRAFARHIEAVTGIKNKGVVSSGASDASHFIALGIDCIVTWPIGGGHHSDQEWIDAQSLEHIVPVVAGYVREMAYIKTEAVVEQNTSTR